MTDTVFLAVFTGEMMVKIVAMGFFMDKGSYLRDTWNWLDFFVVVSGIFQVVWIDLMGNGGSGGGLGILRLFRILRPLKTLSASQGMRNLVQTVFLSIPKLGSVLAMGIFLFLLFAIVGQNFFGGVRCLLNFFNCTMRLSLMLILTTRHIRIHRCRKLIVFSL